MSANAGSLRLTPQRRAVLDALYEASDHPTAGEVYDRVRAAVPGIGAATVYRTLGLLVAAGLAQELSLGGGASARYDANVTQHDHAVCLACGHARDLDRRIGDAMLADVAARTGFEVTGYDLQFRGACPDCRPAGHPGPHD
jgi:Fur family ferric uptake transcriptional regulator/Fur family peroxide stress response transcriptional regulator